VIQCDFCTSPNTTWAYPCRDFKAKPETATALIETADGLHTTSAVLDLYSGGGWAACPVCHLLIQSGSRDRLARRSAKKLVRAMATDGRMAAGALSLSQATAHTRRLHDQFWTNREGPPVPIDPGAQADPTR